MDTLKTADIRARNEPRVSSDGEIIRNPPALAVGRFKGKDIYVIAPPTWYPEITDRIYAWADGKESMSGKKNIPYRTKESIMLNHVLTDGYDKVKGWLEINNAWFFFVDRRMFVGTCKMMWIRYSS